LIFENYPGLENATLKVSGGCPDFAEAEEVRLADISLPVVRHISQDGYGYDYGGPLKYGDNEILFNAFALWHGYRKTRKTCSLEATVRLPDRRILFSIAMNFTLQWPPRASDGT
jgi:hypothetical protein